MFDVKKKGKQKIVTFSDHNSLERFVTQAVVFEILSCADAVAVSEWPLVKHSIALYRDKSTNGISFQRMEAKEGSIKSALIPAGSYFPKLGIYEVGRVFVDEAYVDTALSSWERTTQLQRLQLFSNALNNPCDSSAETYAISVNFSKRRQLRVKEGKASLSRILRNALLELNKLGPYALALEYDNGRPHLHGLISGVRDEQALKEALCKLAGHTESTAFNNLHRINVKKATFPPGFALYMTKDLMTAPDLVCDQRIIMSQQALRIAKNNFSFLRQQCSSKMGRLPEWRGRAARHFKAEYSGIKVEFEVPKGASIH